jgi:hypothetical protein
VERVKKLLLIAMLGLSSLLFAQTVCLGTLQQCIEAQKRLCDSEPAHANFELTKNELVLGTVLDQTGARFDDGFAVELRRPKTGVVLQSADLKDGVFGLGPVKAGSYRLIVMKQGSKLPRGPLCLISLACWSAPRQRPIAHSQLS